MATPLGADPAPPLQLQTTINRAAAEEEEAEVEPVHPLENMTFKALCAMRAEGALSETEFDKVKNAFFAAKHPNLL